MDPMRAERCLVPRLPDFVIGGTVRAGTTSLYQALMAEPGVWMSTPKEPHFFSYGGQPLTWGGPYADLSTVITDPTVYASLFDGAEDARAVGEASVDYLYLARRAAPRMREAIPDVRLVFVLRDPVARAYSHYQLQRMYGWEPCATFAEALAAEDGRIADGWMFPWHYFNIGLYAAQLRTFLQYFPRDQIHIVSFDDVQEHWSQVFSDVCTHIGIVPVLAEQPVTHVNQSSAPRSALVSRAMYGRGFLRRTARRVIPKELRPLVVRTVERVNFRTPPAIPDDMRVHLAERYRADVEEVAALTGIDVTPWYRSWGGVR